jgi:mycoredoxin-dependent peroxiredoxin
MALSVGDIAPDFELTDQHGRPVRLRDLRGRKAVLVVFYPWAFTGVCGGELRAMQADLADLANDDVELLTVSTDSMYALRAFADQEGFTFSMLSDFWPHGAVADAYGVLHPDVGVALRGTFLVDRDGVIRWSVVNGIGDARDIGDYKRAITALSSTVGAPGRPLP